MKIIRQYGPNKLENSSLCFGTMQFGDGADERDSQEMYEAVSYTHLTLPTIVRV